MELYTAYSILHSSIVYLRSLCKLNVSSYFVYVLFLVVFVFARMLHLGINADFKVSHYTVEPARK